QFIEFDSMANGDIITFEFNGEMSAEVTLDGDASVNATAMKNAIEGIEDITSVTVTNKSGDVNSNMVLEFTGVDGKKSWPVMIVSVLTGTGTAIINRKQYGRPDTDALWSATRGYASCGTFYQGRHWMGGFRSRPDVVVASRAGALFD